MSLYEQYHSDINKNYMFNMIKTILKSEDNIEIDASPETFSNFNEVLINIFKNNNAEDISELNKLLLDNQLNYHRSQNSKPSIQSGSTKTLEELVNEREMDGKQFKKDDNQEDNPDNNVQPMNNVFLKQETVISGNEGTSLDEILSNNVVESVPDIKEEVKENIKEEKKIININSCKRTNINSSRYNYKIDLSREGVESKDISRISRLIIPIEDNHIFSIPVLRLNIPELDCHLYMQQKELIKNNKRSVGIYEPLDNVDIKKSSVNKITIDIRDITDTKYESNDILKINIVEIIDNVIIFTCSNIDPNNFKINDNIKVINNYTEELINLLRYPFSIKHIVDNQIYCRLPYNTADRNYNNIDMKILNISNQNVLFFN